MKTSTPLACVLGACSLLLPLAGLLPTIARADDLPSNLGRGLRPVVEWHRQQPAARSLAQRKTALADHLGKNKRHLQIDDNNAVSVEVRLDGSVPSEEVEKSLGTLGLTITAEHAARRADGGDGILSARLPLEQAEAAAKVPGVFSVLAAHRPRPRVGKATTQGVATLHADAVQTRGFTGAGITVGVLSDSYDVATARSAGYAPTTNSLLDRYNGDLPANGVTVLQDGSASASAGNTDEGRAMLQIIHDMAPNALLAFCTCGNTQTEFAANIRALRTNTSTLCDILVDDIGFSDEPFFSDSVISEAVDDVVTSTTLAGRPVIYYSAAGNDGDVSYSADFTPIADGATRAGGAGNNNLNLSQVPAALTAGGFHNFKGAATGQGSKIVQKVLVSGADAEINFQWDDPFVPRALTTDYNVLVFDKNGNYRSELSGIDNNFHTGEAIEYIDLPLSDDGSDTTYQLVITKASGGGATHLRYFAYTDGIITGTYLQTGQPTLFGHSGAANADGVAAYDVHDTSVPEEYGSAGPVTIYFDAAGNRLAKPVTRLQPTMAAVDGVNTSFFPEGPLTSTDTEGDGYPNFYGTSAAAPHAAGVAALLLQAAGGHSKLTAAQMRSLLQSTAASHDLDPSKSVANFTSDDGQFHVTLTALGDAGDNSSFSQRFFTATYTGPTGSSLFKLAIDIGLAGENFDVSTNSGSLATSTGGYPFTIGLTSGVTKASVTATVVGDNAGHANGKLNIAVIPGTFKPGGILSFGIDRDNTADGYGGNSADVLAGSKVSAHFFLSDGTKVKAKGTLTNRVGTGYSADVGYGLINAEAALNSLLGR